MENSIQNCSPAIDLAGARDRLGAQKQSQRLTFPTRLDRPGWLPLLSCLLGGIIASAAPTTTNGVSRVTAIHNPRATSNFIPDPGVVSSMVDRGLIQFTGQATLADAWKTIATTNDVIGIKILSGPGTLSGTRPAVVEAIVRSLLAAGYSAQRIVIWDKRRHDLRSAGWNEFSERMGIRCVAAAEAGWDASKYYENPLLGRPLFDELEYDRKSEGVGRKSHLSRLLTREVTKIISITPALNHNQAGVNGHVMGLAFGSFDNTLRFENHPDRIAETVPELLATPEIFDRIALCITDALICQYRGEDRTRLHYTVALNELRFGKDPVALDALSIVDMEHARRSNPTDGEKPFKSELYNNTELLELGIADPKRIQVQRIELLFR